MPPGDEPLLSLKSSPGGRILIGDRLVATLKWNYVRGFRLKHLKKSQHSRTMDFRWPCPTDLDESTGDTSSEPNTRRGIGPCRHTATALRRPGRHSGQERYAGRLLASAGSHPSLALPEGSLMAQGRQGRAQSARLLAGPAGRSKPSL